jgi:hypothetical protein
MSGSPPGSAHLPVTKTAVLGITGATDLARVSKLNLFGQGVTHVGVLASETPALQLLSASLNDLSDDAFASICFGCPQLEELYVRGNKIRRPAALAAVLCLSRLTTLWIADNPLAACMGDAQLRQLLLHFQPSLQVIDNKRELSGYALEMQARPMHQTPDRARLLVYLSPCIYLCMCALAGVSEKERVASRNLPSSGVVTDAIAEAAELYPRLGINVHGHSNTPERRKPAATSGLPHTAAASPPLPANSGSGASRHDAAGRAGSYGASPYRRRPVVPGSGRKAPVTGAWAGSAARRGAGAPNTPEGGSNKPPIGRQSPGRDAPVTQSAGGASRAMLTAVLALVEQLDASALKIIKTRCTELEA